MDAHVIEMKWKRFVIWVHVVALSSWTIPTVFCENSTTTQTACESCDLAERHKLYNWLVLCIVLLLLVLLLLLVGFLCHRMWPRDPSVLDRAVCRYNFEQQQGVLCDLTQVSTSSWRTGTTPHWQYTFKSINCDRPQTIQPCASVYLGLITEDKRKRTNDEGKTVLYACLRLAVKTL